MLWFNVMDGEREAVPQHLAGEDEEPPQCAEGRCSSSIAEIPQRYLEM